MRINLPQWHAIIQTWRKGPAILKRQAALRMTRLFRATREFVLPALANTIQISLVWICSEFFEPFSIGFWLSITCIVVIFVLVVGKYYRGAAGLTLAFLISISLLALNAPIYIASDQTHLSYRTVDGVSYLEFPRQWAFLKSIAGDRLINVAKCDDAKVAVLRLLPYRPLFLENNFIQKISFRRLPDIQYQFVRFNVQAKIGRTLASDSTQRRSLGVEIGFSVADQAKPLTSILPRSLSCRHNGVPLIPILEVLPWNQADVGALVRSLAIIDQFRELYPKPISLDRLREMRASDDRNDYDDDNAYSVLLDFFFDSLMYEMFDGNIFAQARADLANTMCAVIDSHPSVFKGPFGALKDNFIHRLVSTLKTNVTRVAPACHVSGELIQAYEKSPPAYESLPIFDAFKECMNATTPMTQCLAKSTAPKREANCDSLACSTLPLLTDEMWLEDYDRKYFFGAVATKQNKLVDIGAITPDKCPKLRDREEEKHFVDWWIDHADMITKEPAECSSASWQAKYFQSQKQLHDALACASKRGIRGARYDKEGINLASVIRATKCGGAVDHFDNAKIVSQISTLFGQIDLLIDRLNQYSVLSGDSKIRPLIKALQMFDAIKREVCGAHDIETCIASYKTKRNYQNLTGKLVEVLGLKNADQGPRAIVDTLSKRGNIIIDMAICDALQDKEFSNSTGYARTAYCDSHGLAEYRMIGSEPVGYSIERGGDEGKSRTGYVFESNGTDKEFRVLKFLPK